MINWKQDEICKKWFGFDDNSNKLAGWIKDNDEKWYYLYDEKCISFNNCVDGEMVTGWIKSNDKWYYLYEAHGFNSSNIEHNMGEMATGWVTLNGFYYYFYPTDSDTHKQGEMATGWIQDLDVNDDWYYMYPTKTTNYGVDYPEGAMAVDWVKLGEKNKWYYLLKEDTYYNGRTHSKGACASNITLPINGQNYTFDNNGVWQSISDDYDSLVSDDLVGFIAGWEGFYSKAYPDPYYGIGVKAYWTIGYGTCYCAIPEAFPDGLDSTCTKEQALGWLKHEVNKVANTIKSALGSTYNSMSQQAFDCLCDIGYNAGTGSLIGGNTWNSIISGDSYRITTALMSWNKANGVVSDGLNKRCKGRVNMCLNGVYDSTH